MKKKIPKNKYLIDENLPAECARCLDSLGSRAHTVAELGLKGKQDKEIFSFARKKGYVLVTNDMDFMDNRLYPLRQCSGIIHVPSIQSRSGIGKWMQKIDHVASGVDLSESKIQLHNNSFSKRYICSCCGGKEWNDEIPYGNCRFCKSQEKKVNSFLKKI